MIRKEKFRKITAIFFLYLLLTDIFLPAHVKALTSGPSQPEAKQFSVAGAAEMVDLFTGDFKYNIPLLDVDGYPVNLNYDGNVGMDDEASWAGLGWNVNVGAINRSLRGVPDDMSGDEILTEHYIKPKITVGGRVTGRVEVKGTDMAKVSGSISMGIFSDNYTGIGAEVGGNAGITLGLAGGGTGTGSMGLSAGLGFNSNTSSGVDVNSYTTISLSWSQHVNDVNAATAAISMNLGYNTRQGMKDLSLGGSFGISGQKKIGSGSASHDLATSTFNYNTPSIYPRIQMPFRSTSRTFSGDFGGMAFAVFAGGGFTGYKSVREVLSRNNRNPAFGFLYAERGKKVRPAVMDFLREKDNVIVPTLPNLALPVATPDMFAYSGQGGSGQFRLYSGTSGIYFDAEAKDGADNQTLGGDVGLGAYVHGGVSFYKQNQRTVTGKWENDNAYKDKGDFEDLGAIDPREEGVYFKQVGEKNMEDAGFVNAIKEERPVWVDVNGKSATSNYAYIDDQGVRQSEPITVSKIKKTGRQKRRSPITYLTAAEAAKGGLDKRIKNCGFNNLDDFTPPEYLVGGSDISRVGGSHKSHHLSEISVVGEDGQRMVYGLPVYNIKQEECTFAVDPGRVALDAAEIASKNQVTYQQADKRTDQYYKKETQPAYAASFLLTGLLSPDYVDVTGNGISDDDLGTAVKFNYGKVPFNYKWRTPYDANKGFYNKGLYADPFDDKGSFVYGEKELWYLHSIETKTKIAYFITEDRSDGLGVSDLMGGKNTAVRQKRLAEIRLYSKSDLSKPIKTVVLEHSYTLCGGSQLPNTVSGGGKLTLNKVYFKYGNSGKGSNHPYVFEYSNADYNYLSSDRWGAYKPAANNAADGFAALRNDEFPYATRNQASANSNAGTWLLRKITLPGGGEVQVEYEVDDYAYVQNKKAMEMIKVEGLYKGGTTPSTATNLIEAEWIKLRLTKKPASTDALAGWFRREYLDGGRDLYVKMSVNVTDAPGSSNASNFDFVSAYVEVADAYMEAATDDYIFVKMKPVDGGNPLVVAAWQKMKLEYPMYAYPGYKNRVQDNRPVEAVLSAVINSFRTLKEISENFYERARRKHFADMVDLARSFARVVKTDGKRLGGGSRVKKIKLSDKWADMNNASLNETAIYGQEYSYETTWNGQEISSGVASYEPSVGGDENPLHQPVRYTEDIKGALNNYLYLEEPFGETLFPSPLVGYSKVTVRDLDESGNADPEKMTGFSVNEFCTAREYPVITRHSSIETHNRHPNGFSNFVGGHELHELSMTQGYTVILNDMHGKPKSGRIYNKSGAEISSDVYYYADESLDVGSRRLHNRVYTVNEKGEVSASKEVIGREMELFTDMREEEMSNSGESIHIGLDVIPFIWFPLPIPHWPVKSNDEYRLFRSAAVTKVAHYYGVLEKVVKTQDGSTVVSSNLVFDQVTGNPVVSSTNNEFDDPVYSFQLPAYWAYKQMGGAYQNVNTVLKNFATGANGVISSSFIPYISPGDKLISVGSTGGVEPYWVIYSQPGTIGTKEYRLIDRYGAVVSNIDQDLKIIRSGYRNQLQATTASIVSLDNPVRNNSLQMENAALSWLRVLDANAMQFDEEWGMPDECGTCPPGTVRMPDGNCAYVPTENTTNCFTFCEGANTDAYSADGAWVYTSTADNSPVSVTSPYWGNGLGCQYSGFNIMTAAKILPASGIDSTQSLNQAQSLGAGMGVMSLPGACSRSDYSVSSTYCGRLPKCRIWLCTPLPATGNVTPVEQWIGFETCVNIPQSGTYYIGMGGDNQLEVKIGTSFSVSKTDFNETSNFKRWHLYPLYLPAGPVTVRCAGRNVDLVAGFGMEIYKATRAQILASAPEEIIFSTKDIPGKPVQAFVENGPSSNTYSWRYTGCANGNTVNTCPFANCGVVAVNPYVTGFLGNWRAWKENLYIVNRVDNGVLSAGTKGARIRNSGHYQMAPWWYYNTGQQAWEKATATTPNGKWVTKNTIMLYSKSGQELENIDVLGRSSGAIYGFEGLLPTAVGSNALNRELFYESFEDFNFRDLYVPEGDCNKFTFDFKRALGGGYSSKLSQYDAHTGNYSLSLSSPVVLYTKGHSRIHKSGMPGNMYLTNSVRGEYLKMSTTEIYPNGFAPIMHKKYIFSAWVKDGQPTSSSPAITLEVNGNVVQLTRKAVVEGWKLVEGTVDFSALGILDGHTWKITGSASVKIDDIRIFPNDAHMRTFAYDESTLRVMAELDENNFSSFYEYDEEGSLMRLKKETERGIMTIKETRSSLRKN